MIPKIIHYCWFGKGQKTQQMLNCIQSWKKNCPDYLLKEWNENNFDIKSNQYVNEAYNSKKYAFVADYVRLYALYNEGGIYMDTDVEVLKSFDLYLYHIAFTGFETNISILTGMIAAMKGSIWIKELLDNYKDRTFILPDGHMDLTTNAYIITKYMLSKGLKLNNKIQEFPDICTIYPIDYFCSKDHRTGEIKITENTICIHHFAGSWLDLSFLSRLKHKTKIFLVSIFGSRLISFISDVITFRIFK